MKKSEISCWKKYGICFGYLCIYLIWFFALEYGVKDYHIIRCALDAKIPFCASFIIPYLLWFPFVGLAFWWMIHRESTELFLDFCKMMFGGMTLALIIYTLIPNGVCIRPWVNPEESIFTWMVSMLYRIDTTTNVCPSLHVYTSVMIAFTFSRTQLAKDHPYVYAAIVVMAVLIIASTMLIKQHSVMDVSAGYLMAWAIYNKVLNPWKEHAPARRHRVA